jgi:hemolysin III
MTSADPADALPAALLQARQQSLGEEIANSISHGLALLAALVAAPFLVVGAVRRGDAADIVGASIFAATMVLLYATSMLYHAMPASALKGASRAKRVFQVLDHSAIYLLIAGSYTPFTLGVLRGPWGWTLFGLVWAMALAGVAVKAWLAFATLGCLPCFTWQWAGLPWWPLNPCGN